MPIVAENISYFDLAARLASAGNVGASQDFPTVFSDLEALTSREGIHMGPVATRLSTCLVVHGKGKG